VKVFAAQGEPTPVANGKIFKWEMGKTFKPKAYIKHKKRFPHHRAENV
jgi:hypothetical protein